MIYLASASPRRKELLQQIGVAFQIIPASINEDLYIDESPLNYVQRLAQEKAQAGLREVSNQGLSIHPVLGSDTTVVLGQHIMGKPQNEREGIEMLLALSGQMHQVMTAVAVCNEVDCWITHSITEVQFREITADEAKCYWQTGEPQDKAGGYGIQGFGAIFVEKIRGSYTGVVGLPVYETAQLLRQAGIRLWQTAETALA